jgi:hypothetical protein
MNFADHGAAAELQLPINRWGGNATTRFNYQADISNRASDWFFENIPSFDEPNPNLPTGSSADQFVQANLDTNTATLLTVPLIGWTTKPDGAYACGFSVSKYGEQNGVEPWRGECGTGFAPNGDPVTGNDPLDTSIPIDPTFVQGWMQHLQGQFGTAANGGVGFYNLDNEPMLWSETHRDIHPEPTTYDEIWERSAAYGAMIKATDPTAQILGPATWGWTAYFNSMADVEALFGNPDQRAHDGIPFTEWYLQQMATYEAENGVRLLDYLDLHYYPQGQGIALGTAGNEQTQAYRLRTTRSLWDPTYVDESWIGEPVQLIPRMRDWVATNYPGTKIAIGEYNFGGFESINGAVTQAEVLGIFGREQVDLAAIWEPPGFNQPAMFAFRMYRNYDGMGSQFGDTSLTTDSSDPHNVSVFAAQRADGKMTVMVINKSVDTLTSTLNLVGNASQTAKVFQYSRANLNSIQQLDDIAINDGQVVATFPGYSITLFELD